MTEIDDYLLSKKKYELKNILRSIEKEKEPERFHKIKFILENYDDYHPIEAKEEKDKKERRNNRKKILQKHEKWYPRLKLISRFSLAVALLLYAIGSIIKRKLLNFNDVFSPEDKLFSTIFFLLFSTYAFSEGINMALENAYTNYINDKLRAFTMIFIGFACLITLFIMFLSY